MHRSFFLRLNFFLLHFAPALPSKQIAPFMIPCKNALLPHTAAVLKGGLPPRSACFGKNKALGRVVLRNSFPAALRKQSGALLRYYFALK